MDYGIIFIIIIVILIIIGIILIIVANRNNVTNIVASLPSYRILYTGTTQNSEVNYLGLKNATDYAPSQTAISINDIEFWKAFSCIGVDNTNPMGIWKIENLSANNNIPITSGSQVKLINLVYYNETLPHRGYLAPDTFLINNKIPLIPGATAGQSFTYTVVGTNLFTLRTTINNLNLPVMVDTTNNFLVISNNTNDTPSVFRLVFQQQ